MFVIDLSSSFQGGVYFTIQPGKAAVLYEEMENNVKDDPVQIFSVIEWRIQYKNDIVTYGALNHLATTEEVLERGEDDCDRHVERIFLELAL